jgi:hypothetical protein
VRIGRSRRHPKNETDVTFIAAYLPKQTITNTQDGQQSNDKNERHQQLRQWRENRTGCPVSWMEWADPKCGLAAEGCDSDQSDAIPTEQVSQSQNHPQVFRKAENLGLEICL